MTKGMLADLLRATVGSTAVRTALLASVIGLGGCAGADYRPVVDMTGHTQAQYDSTLANCQATARQARNNEDIAVDTGVGALGGAALGAVGGAIGGNPGLGAGVGALAGAVGVGAYKESETENREQTIVKNCMRNKGFTVLD